MGSNPLSKHFQWSGKVIPACERGLQPEVSVWLPGLEQLQPLTWMLAAFPVGSKMSFVSAHTQCMPGSTFVFGSGSNPYAGVCT